MSFSSMCLFLALAGQTRASAEPVRAGESDRLEFMQSVAASYSFSLGSDSGANLTLQRGRHSGWETNPPKAS